MNLWQKLKLFRIFGKLILNPARTELIFEGVEVANHIENYEPLKIIENQVMEKPGFAQLYSEKYLPEAPSLQKLAGLPQNTFGHAVYRHMHNSGLNFDLWPKVEINSFLDYLSSRIYQDHDLWHALLGYSIELEDELALQAFGVAQFRSPLATLLVAGGLLHLLWKNPMRAVDGLHRVADGYNRGKNAKFLLSVRLHEHFDKPLAEVRQLCQIGA